MYRILLVIAASLAVVHLASATSPLDSLRLKIERAVEPAQGRVGVAVVAMDDSAMVTIDGHGHYPMQSVYKFPVALAVLSRVDSGILSLDQKLHLTGADLRPNTWSPLREKYPGDSASVWLDEVLKYTVSLSDNNGCDILFRLVGGPAVVDRYIHALGVSDIAIVATEQEMQSDRTVPARNWSTPAAMAQLLYLFGRGDVLSEASTEYLWQLMVGTRTGPHRLKGQLPDDALVAHKTGSSGTDASGMTPATNDVGIMQLPDGRRVGIVVYVADSSADEATRDAVIATIARIVWDAGGL